MQYFVTQLLEIGLCLHVVIHIWLAGETEQLSSSTSRNWRTGLGWCVPADAISVRESRSTAAEYWHIWNNLLCCIESQLWTCSTLWSVRDLRWITSQSRS